MQRHHRPVVTATEAWVALRPVAERLGVRVQSLYAHVDGADGLRRALALRGLDAAVPQFWFEIAQSIGALEAAAEDEASPHRELASLVASKVD